MAQNSNHGSQLGLALALLSFVVVASVAGEGFWVRHQVRQEVSVLTQELKRQKAELTRIEEALTQLGQRAPVGAERCAAGGVGVSNTQLQAAIDQAVQKSVGSKAQELSLEQDDAAQPTVESQENFESGEQLIGRATAAHRWTDAEAASFRGILGHVHGDQGAALLQRLSVAINSGQLTVQTAGPPF
jgi:hypothetical protein